MEHCSEKPGDAKEILAFGPDSIEMAMRTRIRETIEAFVEEELDAALGERKSVRVGARRQGYRHGTRERTLTTSLGPTTFAMPRARIQQADGSRTEWRSETVRRYERRTTRVDETILGVYLAGGNTRRIRGALAPLLKGGPLSKDAVSRLVGRLREDFERWRTRDLSAVDIRYVFMDGWYPKVRVGGRRERVPVLVTRRDAGAVDQARLESDSGDAHRVMPEHLFAQSIQRVPPQNASWCESVNVAVCGAFEATLHSFYRVLSGTCSRTP